MVRRRRHDGVVAVRCFVALLALTRPAPGTGSESSDSALRDIASAAARDADYVVAIRRELHRNPELMWEEFGTSALVKRELESMGIEHRDVASPGVVGFIGTGRSPAVLLRADMDALPVLEESDASFFPDALKSRNKGIMHACGHDGHVAMLLGAAKLLKRHESSLNGTVYLAFQPAEEGGAGARKMMENGLVAMTPRVDAAFALHNWPYPETPSGTVGTRAGTIMAGSAAFEITLTEASSENAVVCAAGVVEALQTVIARRVDPRQPALVTVAAVQTLEEPKPASGVSSGGSTPPTRVCSRLCSRPCVSWPTGERPDEIRVRRRLRREDQVGARGWRIWPAARTALDGERRARRGSGRARGRLFRADAVSDAPRRRRPQRRFPGFAQTWPSAMPRLGASRLRARAPLHAG